MWKEGTVKTVNETFYVHPSEESKDLDGDPNLPPTGIPQKKPWTPRVKVLPSLPLVKGFLLSSLVRLPFDPLSSGGTTYSRSTGPGRRYVLSYRWVSSSIERGSP